MDLFLTENRLSSICAFSKEKGRNLKFQNKFNHSLAKSLLAARLIFVIFLPVAVLLDMLSSN